MHDDLGPEVVEQLRQRAERQRGGAKAPVRAEAAPDAFGFATHALESEREGFAALRARFAGGPTPPEGFRTAAERAKRHDELVAAWRQAQPACPSPVACGGRCAGERDVLADWEAALAEDARRAEANQERQEAAQRRAAVPARLVALGAFSRTAEDWRRGVTVTGALTKCREVIGELRKPGPERGRTLLLLCGIVGAGKTTAAVAAVGDYLATPEGQPRGESEPLPAYFVQASEWANTGLYGAEARAIMTAACTADVLVVDDTGLEYMAEKGPWVAMLDQVISARHGEWLPTILTTNQTKEAFFKQHGERVRSRFFDAGRIHGCRAEDWRRRALGGGES